MLPIFPLLAILNLRVTHQTLRKLPSFVNDGSFFRSSSFTTPGWTLCSGPQPLFYSVDGPTKVTPFLLSAGSSDTGQCNAIKGILVKELSLSLLLDVNKEACCSDCCWQPFPSKATSLRMNQCCDWQLGEVVGSASLTTRLSHYSLP